MVRAGAELVESADIIAAVPLHRWRLVRRRYNHAAILANAIGRMRGKLVIPDLLVRRRANPSQGHLGRSQRQRNVSGAFVLPPAGRKSRRGLGFC
jgi:predicted amidophosphoribosyltransferase